MLHFWNYKFWTVGCSIGLSVELLNFVAIDQTVVEISRFWIFQDGGSHHLGFVKFYIFNERKDQERRTASLCQILSKSLKPRRRYVSFRFFKMAAAAILNFRNFKIFNDQNGEEGRTASARQISSKSLEPRLRYNNFLIFFKMAAVRYRGLVMRVWGPPTKSIWWSLPLSKIWLESMQYFL